MAHATSIGAGIFSDLAITTSLISSLADEAACEAAFAAEASAVLAGNFQRIKNVRTFPSIGTPANISKVPVFGQATSQQVQGQADAPNLELTINYIPADWAAGTTLGAMVGDGKQRAFRFALMNSQPPGYASSGAGASALGGPTATPVDNTEWYWIGKIEALLVNTQLTDANTATLSLSCQSAFLGAFTVAAAA